jgi:hypothetical protein
LSPESGGGGLPSGVVPSPVGGWVAADRAVVGAALGGRDGADGSGGGLTGGSSGREQLASSMTTSMQGGSERGCRRASAKDWQRRGWPSRWMSRRMWRAARRILSSVAGTPAMVEAASTGVGADSRRWTWVSPSSEVSEESGSGERLVAMAAGGSRWRWWRRGSSVGGSGRWPGSKGCVRCTGTGNGRTGKGRVGEWMPRVAGARDGDRRGMGLNRYGAGAVAWVAVGADGVVSGEISLVLLLLWRRR